MKPRVHPEDAEPEVNKAAPILRETSRVPNAAISVLTLTRNRTGAQRLTRFKVSKSTTVYPWCRVATRTAKDSLSRWSCARHPRDSSSEESLVASDASKEAKHSPPPRDRISLLLTSPLFPSPRPRCPVPGVLKRLQEHRAVVRSVERRGERRRARSGPCRAPSRTVDLATAASSLEDCFPNIGPEISVTLDVSSSQYDLWLASGETSKPVD